MGTIFPYVEGLKFRKGVEMPIYVSVNDLTVAALEDFTFLLCSSLDYPMHWRAFLSLEEWQSKSRGERKRDHAK